MMRAPLVNATGSGDSFFEVQSLCFLLLLLRVKRSICGR